MLGRSHPHSAAGRARAMFVTAVFGLAIGVACGEETSNASRPADAAPDTVLPDVAPEAGDAALDAHGDAAEAGEEALAALHAAVSDVVGAIVDPSGGDPSRAVGAVVVLVSEPHTSVVGVGALRKGGQEAPDGDTFFQIGSVTKVFTGLLLAARVEQGVEPDTPVADLLVGGMQVPDFEGVPITVEQLASHYGAMPDELPDNVSGPAWSPAMGYSRADLATFLEGYVLPYAPGTQYVYSNIGSGLLGLALADESGHTGYHELLADLTGPLGMSDTGTNEPSFVAGLGDRLAQGYSEQGGALVEVGLADMGVLAGGGEVVTTGNDLASLLRVLAGLEAHPVPGTVERALTPSGPGAPGTQIGYGFNISVANGSTTYEKSGSVAGYSANLRFRRDPAIAVAVVANRGQTQEVVHVAQSCLELLEAYAD